MRLIDSHLLKEIPLDQNERGFLNGLRDILDKDAQDQRSQRDSQWESFSKLQEQRYKLGKARLENEKLRKKLRKALKTTEEPTRQAIAQKMLVLSKRKELERLKKKRQGMDKVANKIRKEHSHLLDPRLAGHRQVNINRCAKQLDDFNEQWRDDEEESEEEESGVDDESFAEEDTEPTLEEMAQAEQVAKLFAKDETTLKLFKDFQKSHEEISAKLRREILDARQRKTKSDTERSKLESTTIADLRKQVQAMRARFDREVREAAKPVTLEEVDEYISKHGVKAEPDLLRNHLRLLKNREPTALRTRAFKARKKTLALRKGLDLLQARKNAAVSQQQRVINAIKETVDADDKQKYYTQQIEQMQSDLTTTLNFGNELLREHMTRIEENHEECEKSIAQDPAAVCPEIQLRDYEDDDLSPSPSPPD